MNKNQALCKNNSFSQTHILNCNGKVLKLDKPVVMGILNITTDSFYDGGRYLHKREYLLQAEKMLNEGAAIIDIGASSTRPASKSISEKEELNRLLPALQSIRKRFPDAFLSVDTFRASVAGIAFEHGSDIINDISGGTMDDHMYETISRIKVPYVMMHIQGTPETMQKNPVYSNVVNEIIEHFNRNVKKLKVLGIHDVIIDPGFGFGKSLEHNFEILRNLDRFVALGLPLMVGLSRKSMINKALQIGPGEALNGTTVLNTMAILKGAHILRVHDVKEAVEVIKLCGYISGKPLPLT
jgi:dihydropteroate synthase